MSKNNFSDRKSKKVKKTYNFHMEPKIDMNTITAEDLNLGDKKKKNPSS
ncbi:hypothetical protein QBE52_06160 [Clostridiaceae bacterium 35-E11]